MTLKTIKINKKIYKMLLERKKEDETITDVIARILNVPRETQNINSFFGLWKSIPEEFLKIIETSVGE
ncbi:MAG: hypothetical protein GF317_17420 [Candidatus Lokiarchaeota archaeon]|nr:hypothetical protein [Candidatus Lokiarchaeota archaeon]MBD3201300.1 hypothetical protein [Candidatus Lokiarchaeota archaeon]